MPERKTVGQLMEEMRLKAGAQNYHGHEYMDLQRFAEDTRHMISTAPTHPAAGSIVRSTPPPSGVWPAHPRWHPPGPLLAF